MGLWLAEPGPKTGHRSAALRAKARLRRRVTHGPEKPSKRAGEGGTPVPGASRRGPARPPHGRRGTPVCACLPPVRCRLPPCPGPDTLAAGRRPRRPPAGVSGRAYGAAWPRTPRGRRVPGPHSSGNETNETPCRARTWTMYGAASACAARAARETQVDGPRIGRWRTWPRAGFAAYAARARACACARARARALLRRGECGVLARCPR